MDNQEAIRLMRNLPTMCEFTDAYGEPIDSDAYYEAVDIAISALHAQDAPDINVGSMISRQDAIDRINEYIEEYSEIDSDGNHSEKWCAMQEAKMIIENMPSAQPESTRTFVELVVEYPKPELCTYKEYKGKPYYSIKYIENGETYVGYGTYNPEVLSQYLKEYFISSAQPEPSTEIQEILDYLDNTLHPIVSPDNWHVYSELHDMVSKLPSAQPEIVRCKDCRWNDGVAYCEMHFRDVKGDYFCSWAERKTNER